MKNTYLVQRLTRKPESDRQALITRTWGGGMLALSPEAWKLLQAIFDIDYMGASEFEFGALPRCLRAMATDAKSLTAFEMTIPGGKIKPNYAREMEARKARNEEIKKAKEQGVKPPRAKSGKALGVADATVYVICRKHQEAEVRAAIVELAGGEVRLKEGSRFPQALDPIEEYDRKYIGWIDIENGFFWFTEREAYLKTAELFEVTAP